MKLIIEVFLTFCSLASWGQNGKNFEINKDHFYCLNWIIESPDTLEVFNSPNQLNQRKYTELKQIKNGKYDHYYWTGTQSLESPTELAYKLKIKFDSDMVIFKFKKEKIIYRKVFIYGKMLLIKENH